jgi:hypothetical protein
VRKRLGRPSADPEKIAAARRELAKGTGVLKTAKLAGPGYGDRPAAQAGHEQRRELNMPRTTPRA